MTTRPNLPRDLLDKAALLGFRFVGYARSGHLRFHNADTNATVFTAATPSDHRSYRNALAEMERRSGRKLPRANASKYKTVKVTATDMAMAASETEAVQHQSQLMDRADGLRRQWDGLLAHPSRDNAAKAREVLADYEEIRAYLAKHHRIIAPLGA